MTITQQLAAWQGGSLHLWQPARYGGPGQYEAALFGELTADGRSIVLVTEGTEWGLSQVGARLSTLTPLLESPVDERGNKIKGPVLCPATWAAVVQLGYTFNGLAGFAWVPGPELTEWIVAETVRRTTPPEPLDPETWPPWLTPRPYQLDGAAMIRTAGKVLLLDEPGTGKTVTTLLGIEARRRAGIDIFPMVIVVPSWEVGDSWREHIREWAPAWGTPRMHGGDKRVRVITAKTRPQYVRDVFITTYATSRRDALPDDKGPLCKLRAATVVADEFHLTRNPNARQTLAVQRIARHATTFTGCSGTAVVRNAGDVHGILEAMDRWSFPARERFVARYLTVTPADYGEGEITGLDSRAEPELRAALAGQMRRVAKADVLNQLPPKIYSVRRPEIPPEWRHAYDTMEAQMLAELPDGTDLPVMDTLTQLTRLSQLASSAADVEMTMVYDEKLGIDRPHYTVTLKSPSWKAESLLGILAERPDQPTAVFTESRQLAMITGQYCEQAGLRTGYIAGVGDGNAYRITSATRQAARDGFQAGKLDVIVCTAGAGGTGITLTAANCVVMLQRSWQLDLAIQPEDRVHRIGAEIHDHVEVIDIVTKDTVDQRRRDVLKTRAGHAAEWAQDSRIVRSLLGGLR
jgi:SNF2 family DNA or RNA helicase